MKRTCFFLLLCALAHSVSAQDEEHIIHKRKGYDVKYKLMINPGELILQNISVSAERLFYRHSLGVTLGFKPAIQSSGTVSGMSGLFGDYNYNNSLNQAYNAASFGVNSKMYFHPQRRKNIYLDGRAQYRHWWLDNKNIAYPDVEGYRFDGTRTERMNVYNAKVLFGCSVASRKGHVKFVADFYAGVDLRYKAWNYTTTNGTVWDTYYSYLNEKGNCFIGSPCIGVQLGVGK